MKQITTLLMLLTTATYCSAQFPKDEATGKVIYTEVVELSGLDKQKIYDKAKLWVVSTLKSGDNMVELSGSSSDQLVGTGNLTLDDIQVGVVKVTSVTLNFKFIVFCKDGKYKYEVSNFLLSYNYVGTPYSTTYTNSTNLEDVKAPSTLLGKKAIPEFQQKVETQVHSNLTALIQDFKTSMSSSDKDEDW